MSGRKRLGEILIEAGLLTETQLDAAMGSQETWGGKLGTTLVRMGFVKEDDLLRCLSAQLRLPSVDFRKVKVSPKALQLVPLRIAEKHNVFPVELKEEVGKKTVILAMSDPTNLDSISEIQFQTGITIRPVVASGSAISRAINEYYGRQRGWAQHGSEHPQRAELSHFDVPDEMVILSRGEETRIRPTSEDLRALDALELVRLLVRVLEEKGVIRQGDLEEAARRSR